jgi:DNA-damage-inducible protein J
MGQISVRVEDDVKRDAERVLDEIGLSMSAAIGVFLRKVGRERRIPFELTADVPNAQTVAAIEEVQRMKADPSLGKTYTNVDAMMEELLRDV